jgi:predicted N-acyltransferase
LPEPAGTQFRSQLQLLPRKSVQFHWHNHEYRDFEDFLEHLTSKKRKQIRRERRQVRESGIDIEVLGGDRVSPEQWRAFYAFYCSTFHRRWGSPRLTLEFFRSLSDRLPAQTVLLLARKNREYVAGAFAMRSGDTLYGRHWGCAGRHEFLHFELCYYQTIEYCINNGLSTLDAGVQGEHKLSRGFEPVVTWSYHWIRHPGFRKAVRDFLETESLEIDAYVRQLAGHLPFKHACPSGGVGLQGALS